MAYPAGERYEYADVGYSLLGEAGARAAGSTFEELLQDRLITPMELQETFLGSADGCTSGVARRYDEAGDEIQPYVTATPPSGELYASVHDLSAFAMQLLGRPINGADPVLRDTARTILFSPVFEGRDGAFASFGWEGCDVAGERVITKIGGQPGACARLTLLPERRVSIAIVANRSDNHLLVETLTSELASLFIQHWAAPVLDEADELFDEVASAQYAGTWTGTLINNGVTRRLRLRLVGEGSDCAIGEAAARPIVAVRLRDGCLTFDSVGFVSPDRAPCDPERVLAFKLIERGGRLVGRCLEQASAPGCCSLPPYIATLVRSHQPTPPSLDDRSLQASRR